MLHASLLLALAAPSATLVGALGGQDSQPVSAHAHPDEGGQTAAGASMPPPPLVLERGAGLSPMHAPRAESLEFRVHVDVAMLEAAVGTVVLSSTVEPYREALIGEDATDGESEEKQVAIFRCHARGDYTLYSIDALIETRVLPQVWPRIQYRYTHSGSENRRRELQVGSKEQGFFSRYRSDTSRGAPEGKRIWRKPRDREVPEGTLDMLSAVYLAREMIERDLASLSFPMIDKERVWLVNIARGSEKRIETPAGTFDALEIVLRPEAYPGEEIDPEDLEKFEGLFGIRGSIHLWFEIRSGVPIRIQGDLPIGPLTLGIDVVLQSATGTPPSFRSVVPLPGQPGDTTENIAKKNG